MADYDPGLHRAISQVSRNVLALSNHLGSVEMSVDAIGAEVGSISADMSSTRADLAQLAASFEKYVLKAERVAAWQRSETVIGNVKAELEREYGHYNKVRLSTVGLLQAFDVGNVSERMAQQVSEELMIQTPRYWLAPALVAIAAWSRDDKSVADKSVAEAFRRDPAKTGLFFALVLRRQGRMEAATRWLRHYLRSLDPRSLTREFAMILEATSQEAFGAPGRAMVAEQLLEWNCQLREDPAVTDQQVGVWGKEIAIHRGVLDQSQYPHLAKITPQWPAVASMLEHASAHRNVIEKYQGVRDTPVYLNPNVADRLDEILEVLVSEYDTEELPFAREVIYHEAVIEFEGDEERAKETAAALSEALEETLDLVTLQTQTALRPELMGTSVSTQQVAIGIGRNDFATAIDRYDASYRANYVDDVDIILDGKHSEFAINLGFVGWQSNTAVPQQESEQSLAAAWEQTMRGYLERVRLKPTTWVIAGAIAFVGLLLLIVAPGAFTAVLFFAALAGAGGWAYLRKREADRRTAEALAMRDQAMRFSIDVFRAAVAEFVDAKLCYQEEDALAADLAKLVNTWPVDAGVRVNEGVA
ncbi:MAG: hypothetical protein WBA38_16595 [Gordonia sp. (in: high G+C Gram-positive bacteria)]|uniref:hypothetical protein n=1 Tax=Gordonia sp. (in: high G+C Gram-positive bacteria) TaxID=84139 RepID=UPI003C7289C3